MTAWRQLSAITILTALTVFLPVSRGRVARGTAARGQVVQGVSSQVVDPAIVSVLNREQAAAIMPATVFFRGQTATVQARNSAGLRITGGKLVLTAVVDTGGYSTSIAERYQAYLITEVPLAIDGSRLPPGAYGFGFLNDGTMTIMDLGGNQVLSVMTTKDAALPRPNPLQIMLDAPHTGNARLYLGRSYVTLRPLGL